MTLPSIFWWSNPLCWTVGLLLLFGKGKRYANWSFACGALAFALGSAAGLVDGIRCRAGDFIWLSSNLLTAGAGMVAIRFADDTPVDEDRVEALVDHFAAMTGEGQRRQLDWSDADG